MIKKIVEKIKNSENLPFILIICLLGLTPLLWLKDGFIIAGHDAGLPLDPITHFIDRLYLWTQRYGIGSNQSFATGGFFIHGLEALISWFGFSLTYAQRFLFIIWFALPGLALYYLGKTISSKKEHRIGWLIASVFYMYNHFLLQAWFVAERTKFTTYIALPLVFALFFKVYENKISVLKASILVSITLFFLNGGGFLPLYGALLIGWITAFVYFLFINTTFSNLKRLVSFTVLSFICTVLINAYWVIPYAYSTIYSYSSTLESVGGIAGVKGWIDTISQNTTYDNLIRLQGIQEWYVNLQHPYARFFLENPLILLLSFSIPVLAYLSIFIVSREIKKFIIFFALFSLVSMIFSAGSQPPFGFFYIFLVEHIPGFAIFRTPFYKFATGIWLSYAILLGFTVNYLIQRYLSNYKGFNTRYLSVVIAIGLIILYSFPFLSGVFFDYETGAKTTRIKVPEYIYDANKKLNSITGHSDRTLLIPEHNDGINIESYKWGFWSLATLESLISDRSFVSNNASMSPDEKILMKILYTKILENDLSWVKLARLLSISGFLVRNDFDWSQARFNTHKPQEYEDALIESRMVTKQLDLGEWKYYRLNNSNNNFRISQNPIVIKGESEDLRSLISLDEVSDKSVLIFSDRANEQLLSDNNISKKTLINMAQCVRCDLSKIPVFLPGVDWFGTGSLLYSWTKQRETKELDSLHDSSEKIKHTTETSNKRLVSVFASYFQKRKLVERVEALSEYNEQLRKVEAVLKNPVVGDIENLNKELVITEDYLVDHQNKLEGLFENTSSADEESALMSSLNTLKETLEKTREIAWRTINEVNKKYILNVSEKSEYKVLIDTSTAAIKKDISKKNHIDIELDSKHASIAARLRPDNSWIESSPINLSDGTHKLIFNDSVEANHLETSLPLLPLPKNIIREGSNQFKIATDGEELCLSVPLPPVVYEGKYAVEFSFRRIQGKQDVVYYISDGQSKRSSLSRSTKSLKVTPYSEKYFDEVTVRKGEKNVLNFCNKLDRTVKLTSINLIENISLRRITTPVVAFVNSNNKVGTDSASIKTLRINNTKYEVNISADNQSFLVLTQRYDPGWVIYPKETSVNPLDWFSKNVISDPKVDKDAVHFKADGIFNGWQISNSANKYYVVEYLPQRIFYRSVMLTIAVFILFLGVLIRFSLKKND